MKREMTEDRMNKIQRSVQFIGIMAEMIKLEYMSDLIDGRFKNPQANLFAKRIRSDADAIHFQLTHNDRVKLEISNKDFVEEYAGELYRVFHYFIGLPKSQIKEVMDSLQALLESSEAS